MHVASGSDISLQPLQAVSSLSAGQNDNFHRYNNKIPSIPVTVLPYIKQN